VLKRLSRALGTDISSSCLFISPRGIVWIFILSDVITFCAQTVGTVFVIVGGKWSSLGQNVRLPSFQLADTCSRSSVLPRSLLPD